MNTSLIFHKPGLQTSIQDAGRNGFQAYGVPLGGALDQDSAQTANLLVSNPLNSPLLEITYLGPKIEFTNQCQIALTGADISPKLNGIPISNYQTLNIQKGDILHFGKLITGCRTYLAVGGQWEVENFLGSASSFQGKNEIRKGSQIKIKPSFSQKTIKIIEQPIFKDFVEIKLKAGPEFDLFSKQEIANFFSTDFQVSQSSNRMGLRLSEKINSYEVKEELISSGIIPGTVQITNDGHPIVLLADAQTTGGYPRIGNVSSSNINCLGQMKPGDRIRFRIY